MEILEFIGTCSTQEIGNFAEKNGRKSSWNNAKKAIKNYSNELYNELCAYRTYYEEHTNIKRGAVCGTKGKYLHIVHSAVDYIFLIN